MEKNFEELKVPFEKQEKRLSELKNALEIYKKKHSNRVGETLSAIDFAAEKINRLYFYWLYANVRPFVPRRVNKYKMASLTELSVVKIQPFLHTNPTQRKRINAEFAFFCGFSIITGMAKESFEFQKPSSIKRVEDIFTTSNHQRIQWLQAKNANDFPVFSNGLGLFLLFELYALRFQVLMN